MDDSRIIIKYCYRYSIVSSYSLFIITHSLVAIFNKTEKAKPKDSMRKAYIDGKWVPIKPTMVITGGKTKGQIMGMVNGKYIPYKKIGPITIPK